MKRRATRACLCLSPLAFIAVLMVLFAFGLPGQYTETFLGGYADKVAALQQSAGRRIILTGGSGAVFAVRSDLLENELPDYAVVNLGMYAGLGSTVPLDTAVHELREGDIVVFLPEQSAQTLSLFFNGEAMWQAADGHWALLRGLRTDNWPAMLAQLPYFAAQKALFWFRGTPPAGDGVYARASLNRWGDIDSSLRDHNTMPDGYDANMPISFSNEYPTEDFIGYINRYTEHCRQLGVRFFYAFCPMNAAAANRTGLAEYETRLARLLDCPILGCAEDSILDAGWFFDTNFHLNSAGAVLYTARLAAQLKRELGMSPDVSIALPEMPGSAGTPGYQGDDTDADYFRYEAIAGGWKITGLTGEGRLLRRLTVPTRYQGQPITGLDAKAFVNNPRLETLILQPNIRTIPDGAFDGCSSLREIVLAGISPSECTVGQELLRGTGAVILVSKDLTASYLTNYFWAPYADRIQPADTAALSDDAVSEAPDVPIGPAPSVICYDGNGGYLIDDSGTAVLEQTLSATHARTNTLQGAGVFARPGFVQISWNTAADGSGADIGLGSRFAAEPGMTLYARWAEESPLEAFSWEVTEDTVWITGYSSAGEICVIPSVIDRLPVRGIAAGAFRDAAIGTLVIPPSVTVIEPDAFTGSTLHTLYLFDSLETVSDDCFAGCTELTTLHVNAATAPVYSISYYASFADKYDWLLSLSGQKKLVLFSGSSTRYGYDSAMLHHYYPEYEVANMGVYAYTNALPQMEIILPCLDSGDVLLHAPEFDCLNFQMCENNQIDFHFWAMMEANYDCVSILDLRDFSKVFDSFGTYLGIRGAMSGRDYEETPNGYDDDGNNMRAPTYNQYGDFIMPRANNKIDIMLKYVRSEYTVAPFTQHRIDSINREYSRFLDQGIRVLFTYTPRNRSSISEDSTPENRQALERLLKEQLCVPVISSLENSLMSGVYFFVIDSHLSTEGVRLFTLQIVQDLEPWM